MIPLSRRTKESLKTALAMTIAYGIALAMDWDRPYWAGFAVAACSLGAVGQSLNQAAMRMLGTFVAVIVALAMIALFPQQRWDFMVLLSAWVGLCVYMMCRSKRSYFWYVAGFVCLVVTFDGGVNSENSFNTAILRLQETGLGILAYGLVTSLVWPTNSYADFDAALREQVSIRLRLYRAYLQLMRDPGSDTDTQELRAQGVQLQMRLNQLLEAAIIDTYEVWEVRHLWRDFRRQAADLNETMERWRHTFSEVQTLDLQRLLPDLAAVGDELERRFIDIAGMLNGQSPGRRPTRVELTLDEEAVSALPHFQRAAIFAARTRLHRLETLSRTMFDTVQDIKGFGPPTPEQTPEPGLEQTHSVAQSSGFTFDRDRIAAAARAMMGLWVAYFVWIYTTVPGGTGFVVVVGVFGMMIAPMAHVSVAVLVAPLAVAVAAASALYIFILPHFSLFAELGTLIFAVTFVICYLFYSPQHGLKRALGLAMFVLIAAIDNQQTYTFLHVAITSIMLALGLMLLWIIGVLTTSPRPEAGFLRRLGRFFASCDYLLSEPWRGGRQMTWLRRCRRSFHIHEIASLPAKLGPWGATVDKSLPGASPQELQAVLVSLQELAHRMRELVAARDLPQADFLVQELLDDVVEWRTKLQEFFHTYSGQPGDLLHERLVSRLSHLETRIEETVNKSMPGVISEQDRENFYRLLGAYRSVSETMIYYARATDGVDWARWREARF